jgi:4-hydroxy-tetrahydrodipicolinate synthase
MPEMIRAALADDWTTARAIHNRFLHLMNANFIESNPGPVKAVLAMMGRIEEVYRLPMVPLQPQNRAKLERIAAEAGVLKNATVAS